MKALLLAVPLLSAACTAPAPVNSNAPAAVVRPVTAADPLEGRWTITAINGGQVGRGLHLELGAVEARAELGCNSLRTGGWSRSGDRLFLKEPLGITERGCEGPVMQLERQAFAVLRAAMVMELTEPNRLRLVNEHGTIDLVKDGVPK